jgi:hypothetical protein
VGGLWGIERDEGYVRIDGLGITWASFDNGTREANAGIEEPVLEFYYFLYFGGEKGAGGVPLVDTWTGEIKLNSSLKIA